ncbi:MULTISPECIES: vWA domain-containing protein [Streptomyces]|uniref:vWA domain-containing protein n=1 Tax=Streptomyces TaxID=1883 RepID=UPI00292EA498|nr:hypothetical protein [Streptomyces sp. NEAU-HV9]
MTEPVSLIVNRSPVPRMAVGPTKATQPHLAVVYATASGEVECFEGRPMTPSQQVFSKYRTRYEVDLRGYRRSAVLGRNPLVSRDGVHAFEVKVDFGFRVDGWDGAKNLVRSGIDNPLPLVHNYLISLFHGAGQRFAIEDSFGLQHYLGQRCGQQVTLAEGLVIYGCQVSVQPDAKSKAYLESLIEAGRRETLGQAEHVPNMGDVLREGQIAAKKQEQGMEAAARQAEALRHVAMDSEGLIRQYMNTHPEDAAGAFDMLRKLEEARFATAELQNQRALALFQAMADKNLVQAGDLEVMRQLLTDVVGRATGGATQLPAATTPQLPGARPWDAPAAQLPSASTAGSAQTQTQAQPPPSRPAGQGPGFTVQGPGSTVQGPGSTVVGDPLPPYAGRPAVPTYAALIYLVLDESLDRDSLQELNRGLNDLHSALSGAPEVARSVRLSVLGMAATAEPRLQLETVTHGTRTPILTGRPGLSYSSAFQLLKTVVGQDVAVVKGEGVQVLRPIVYFLTGGVPDEGNGWREAHERLTDTGGNPAAPNVIALGLGRADAFAVRAVATRPEFGFMAPPNQDAVSAAHSCAAFLRDSVVGYARRLASGDPQFSVNPPDGFRRAEDAY